VPVETPLQSKIDVTKFRRVLVAGFVTELGDNDLDVSAETSRLLQNQLRSGTKLQVLEPDRPPLHDALEKALEKLGEGGKYPLIITGRIGLEEQNRSGFQSDERVVRDPGTNRPRLLRGSRYLERKGFSLSADFHFVDGQTGQTLHKEKFTEEVLYSEEQKTSSLSSYFELMDRLLPNFLGVVSPQKIRGTRVLLY
jgi:hypothetical protein